MRLDPRRVPHCVPHCVPHHVLLGLAVLLPACLHVAPDSAADDSLAARRRQVLEMTPAQQRELAERLERFEALVPADQARLRRLDQQLRSDPAAQRLADVMQRYHQWYESLSAVERTALQSLPVAQRVSAVRRGLERQERERFLELAKDALTAEDHEVVLRWLTQLAYDRLPPAEQERLDRIENVWMRGSATMFALRRAGAAEASDPNVFDRLKPTPEQVQQLVEQLSPAARQVLAEAKGEPERRRLLRDWINAAFFSRIRGLRGEEIPPQFLERLDPQQREFLENLPPDEMQAEIERLYLRIRALRGEPRRPRLP